MEDTPDLKCPNCHHLNSPEFRYCEECGQKNRPIRITFIEFIQDFLSLVFNIENKFWKTFKYLFIPGKLTTIFFQGKRKSFYHPLRLYLVCVLLFFTVLSFLDLDKVINSKNNSNIDFAGNYKTEKAIFQQKQVLNKTLDSLSNTYTTQQERNLLDSLHSELYLVHKRDTSYIDNELKPDSSYFKIFTTKVQYTWDEIYTMDTDELVASKNIENFFERLFFTQFVKGAKDLGSLNNFLFANLTWLFLAIVPVYSLILKLFYIRRNRYFMEHFVFLLHLFSAMILAASLFMILFIPFEKTTYLALSLTAVATIFPFAAFLLYYEQGVFKTIIKFLMIGLLFLLGFIFTFALFLIITAALF